MYIVGDDPGSLTFTAACDDPAIIDSRISVELEEDARRRYAAHLAMTRLHQAKFRQHVLTAYRHRCTLCRLKHDGLLDAAHILGDRHPRGQPVVSNGLALCKIHHAAFDTNILGIRPDHGIEINSKVLEERDGPMLRHGIQEMHGGRLVVLPRNPEQQPDRDRLEERYEQFLAAG
jgi:putative restriction endonuclease